MAADMFIQMFGGDDYYGRKPSVPEYPTWGKALEDMISANSGILDSATGLAKKSDTANQNHLEEMLRRVIPNYDQIVNNISKNITSETNGEIPADVQAAISGNAAARALSGGYAGSGMHGNLVARDLGLTSLDIMERGQNAAERWLASSRETRMAPVTDVRSMFISPAQSFARLDQKFQRDVMQEKINAAPDPVHRGRADQEMALFGMIMSAYGGGAGYTGQKPNVWEQPQGGGGGGGRGGGGGGGGNYFNMDSGNFDTQSGYGVDAEPSNYSDFGGYA